MMKRKFTVETYQKMGRPDLGQKMYFMKAGQKVWGTVVLVAETGFQGASKGLVLLGLEPFQKRKKQHL